MSAKLGAAARTVRIAISGSFRPCCPRSLARLSNARRGRAHDRSRPRRHRRPQLAELAADVVEAPQELLVAERLLRRLARHERDHAARLEDRTVDLLQRGEALPVRGGIELGPGDELPAQRGLPDPAVLDEHAGVALDDTLQRRMAKDES